MTAYRFIRALQNSLLTRWWWQMWQHEKTGRAVNLPLHRNLGIGWTRRHFKE
jgi:hypothetical protein